MKALTKKIIEFIFVLLLIHGLACSHSRYNLPLFISDPEYPDGVDSLIVTKSDSIIRYLFVDFVNEQKASRLAQKARSALSQADSMWQLLKSQHHDSAQVSGGPDSVDITNSFAELNLLLRKIKDNLQLAEKNFQQAIKFNAFDFHYHDGLAQTYILWAEIEKSEANYEKAASILKDIANNERGEHILFFKLAECYFQLQKWDLALQNYRQAEKVLLAMTFNPDSVQFYYVMKDSMKADSYFTYLYSQAVCLARIYDAREALSIIKKAKMVAPNPNRKRIAERLEEWLNWDNGNIRAAEERNQILELIHQGKYAESVTRLETLKSQLSDPLAIDEIEWRIAGLEFKYLDKREQACDRLLDTINKTGPKTHYSSNLMSTYNNYVTDCGIMHFNLGVDFLQKAAYKQAQKYLERGARINWYGNYKCQLELAKLNRHDPQLSLQIIEKVLQAPMELTITEKLSALEVKLSALKKLGPQYLNETKQIYRQIRELQNK